MATIRNVTIVGASGSLGSPVLNALITSGKFNVTVLKRPSSSSSFPSSVIVKEVDLSSVEATAAALEGQDAVVSTVGQAGLVGQSVFIEAAVAANVKRFIPSDFGCDLANPKAIALPIFQPKIAIHKQLRNAAAAKPDFTYSLICNNGFLDWGLEKDFLLNWKDGKPIYYDGGKNLFSATTLASIGQAVVGVLSHPDETRNRFVYVKDIDISQQKLLEIAKKVTPGKAWEEPVLVSTADMEKSSYESLARGEVNPQVMIAFLARFMGGPPEYGGRFAKDDNGLLGVKGKTEADVEDIFRSLVATS